MKISIISGSSRAKSQSLKVAHFLQSRLVYREITTEVIDLHELNFPPYDPDNNPEDKINQLQDILRTSDGFVLISPEWDGMINHRIISFLHTVGKTMADKPVMAVGVSATYHGGHYPVEQMRMLGPKNNHYVISPEHLVIMNVKDVMNSTDMEGDERDVYIKKRADYALVTLIEYAKALRQVRDSGVRDYDTYPNGM